MNGKTEMQVDIDFKLVSLVNSIEIDLNKAIDEGLILWLKTKLTVCPLTKEFCKSPSTPCNECKFVKR